MGVYAVVAWLVLMGADWLRGVLALPPLFRTLLLGMVVIGVPIAGAMPWRYPHLGGPTAAVPERDSTPGAPTA
jgi:hypothetical protein